METIFNQLIARIAEAMPELSLIDEDYGQLETGEDTYPVTFPCVLVGNLEADWKEIGLGAQEGTVYFSARLAIDCYHDTHHGSETEEAVAGRLSMANKLYTALQGFCPLRNMNPVERTKTRFYALPGGIKVYEHIFAFEVHDESAM